MAKRASSTIESHCADMGGSGMKDGFAADERADTPIGHGLHVNEGMEVIGSNGQRIGQVKQIREKDFLVDRKLARDVYVPFSAVAKSDRCVVLAIPSEKMDDMDWERAPAMGTREDRGVFPD